MANKEKVVKTLSAEEVAKAAKVAKDAKDKANEKLIKENEKDNYFKQPPSDSEFDICGPLNCDKEL